MSVLCDSYAQVFLEEGGEAATLKRAASALMDCAALWEALTSRSVSWEEKARVLQRVLEGEEPLCAFLCLLARKGRLDRLEEISRSCRRLALERAGGALCVMTCVRPPQAEELSAIQAMLCKLHHLDQVALDVRVDPSLLGGFTLELQGVTYDKSVRGGLDALARRLRERETT